MDNGLVTGVVFLDLTKAFDTVNHNILLQKLYAIGVDSDACDWFGSFLHNRSQVTVCITTLNPTKNLFQLESPRPKVDFRTVAFNRLYKRFTRPIGTLQHFDVCRRYSIVFFFQINF
jgi:hypothetical protein